MKKLLSFFICSLLLLKASSQEKLTVLYLKDKIANASYEDFDMSLVDKGFYAVSSRIDTSAKGNIFRSAYYKRHIDDGNYYEFIAIVSLIEKKRITGISYGTFNNADFYNMRKECYNEKGTTYEFLENKDKDCTTMLFKSKFFSSFFKSCYNKKEARTEYFVDIHNDDIF